MIKIKNSILGVGLAFASLTTFTGCIDETQPTDIATSEQVSQSAAAVEGLVMAMPAFFNNLNETFYTPNNYHFNFGYGSMIRIRATLTEPFVTPGSGYDWFAPWAENEGINQDAARSNFVWTYYYKFIQTANNVLSTINEETATDEQKGYIAAAKAFRALAYLDLGRMYEYLPTDVTKGVNADGNDVTGLTVPIVKEGMAEADARNNPRVKKEDLIKFIKEDLEYAEQNIGKLTKTEKTLPHLDCVYGLEARLYMWEGDYAKAQAAAENAIKTSSVQPMTQAQCLNTTTGFNNLADFMWGSQQTSEDVVVSTGIVNWISFMCNEQTFGYCGAGTGDYIRIDTLAYNRLNDTDFRKLEWVAPAGSPIANKVSFVNKTYGASMPPMASVKFRPNQGEMDAPSVAAATAFPVMRVEEMYYIRIEALAQQDAEKGKELLELFMRTRDPKYTCKATSKEDIIKEIYFQKSIDLWGEGITFFDMKRLNYSLTRGYHGTNHSVGARINTNGRPATTNFLFYRTEAENNTALKGWNNPDPSGKYPLWTE